MSEDWNATLLSPSLPVDSMWHQHILDSRNYMADCELLCDGHMIHHDPNGDVDQHARSIRIKRGLLKSQFGEAAIDGSVWTFGPRDNTASSDNSSKSKDNVITLRFQDEEGWITASNPLKEVFCAYANLNLPGSRFQFFFAGKLLHETLTPNTYGFEENDVIWVKAKLQGGKSERITIQVRDLFGETFFFRVSPTRPLGAVFHAVAKVKGVSAEFLRFLLEGQELAETDTPKTLEIMLEQTGC